MAASITGTPAQGTPHTETASHTETTQHSETTQQTDTDSTQTEKYDQDTPLQDHIIHSTSNIVFSYVQQ